MWLSQIGNENTVIVSSFGNISVYNFKLNVLCKPGLLKAFLSATPLSTDISSRSYNGYILSRECRGAEIFFLEVLKYKNVFIYF